MSILEQNVLGLDVAVHDAASMSVRERICSLARDANSVCDRKLLVTLQPSAQCLAFHERHHVEQQSVGASRIEQRQYVRMLKIRRELDLLEKSFRSEHRRELCVQDLYGNLAMMLEVLREIDSRHATRTELTLEAVSAVQRRLESCYWLVRRWAGH